MPAPRPLVVGNWKMHRGGPEAAELARSVVRELGGRAPSDVEVALLPPFPALGAVGEALAGTGLLLGAQDCHAAESGAYTGEVAPGMLAAWKCSLVLCVGESLAERDAGRTAEVLARQAKAGVDGLDAADAVRLVVAYEPVWAIGTGRQATPDQAEEGHRVVREALSRTLGAEGAGQVRVVYGGSVNPGNAAALLAAPGVDGALVGGASLDAAAFAAIVRAAAPVGAARGGK